MSEREASVRYFNPADGLLHNQLLINHFYSVFPHFIFNVRAAVEKSLLLLPTGWTTEAHSVQTGSGAYAAFYPMANVGFSPEVKRLGCDADH
jgi:hypothetical protein